MKKSFFFIAFVCACLALGFVSKKSQGYLQTGCAGANCHLYEPGFLALKSQDNLKVVLTPADGKEKLGVVHGELIDKNGRIVDFKEKTNKRGQMILSAPEPGQYKVLLGYKTDKPAWDSLVVDVKRSVISLSTPMFASKSLAFLPIHPNPVVEAATARFILDKDANVEMSLYKVRGKKIRTLFSGKLKKGMHHIQWEARNTSKVPLKTGNYICELKVGEQKLVQKLYIKNPRTGKISVK